MHYTSEDWRELPYGWQREDAYNAVHSTLDAKLCLGALWCNGLRISDGWMIDDLGHLYTDTRKSQDEDVVTQCRIGGDHKAEYLLWRGNSTSEVLNTKPSAYCGHHLIAYEMFCELVHIDNAQRRVYVVQAIACANENS